MVTLRRRTIRGFAFILGDAYVLFGTTTLVFVMLNCGQETKYECFAKRFLLVSPCARTEIRSDGYLVSSFDLNAVPSLE